MAERETGLGAMQGTTESVSRFRLASDRTGCLTAPGPRFGPHRISMTTSGIKIELTRTQVDQVVRRTSNQDGIAAILRGLAERGLTSSYAALASSPRLSRSLLLGLLVLACFPTDGDALAVTDVATRLGLSPSTTHRY